MARPRKNGEEELLFVMGEVGDGREKVGCEGDKVEERSEFWDMERLPIGTVS